MKMDNGDVLQGPRRKPQGLAPRGLTRDWQGIESSRRLRGPLEPGSHNDGELQDPR